MKLQKYYAFIALAALPFMAYGRQLTPGEALGRLSDTPGVQRLRSKASPEPTAVIKASGNPAFTGVYLFSVPDGGYLAVSADDSATPLLGYSDTQTFDADRMPDGLRYWLQTYADEIEWGASRSGIPSVDGVRTASRRASRQPVTPICEAKWSQGFPYNEYCPMDGDSRTVTGCVATAMAQAMYVSKWPPRGTGSHSYNWKGQTLGVDFGETTYDWDAMTPTYNANSSAEARDAVASLMYSCGVAVNMVYSVDGSGAVGYDIGPALYNYFGYDAGMAQPMRAYYTLSEWEDLIYGQLQEGMPVLYGGQSPDGGGHQFICDGYEGDGYYHFNWGWGGMSDGYFLLTALDPIEQGVGGSADHSGFNFMQNIVINVRPAQADSEPTFMICCHGDFIVYDQKFLETEEFTAPLGQSVPLGTGNSGFLNLSVLPVKGVFGVKITASDGAVSYKAANMSEKEIPVLVNGQTAGYYVQFPADMEEGEYNITPAFRVSGETEWRDVPLVVSAARGIDMTVADGQVHFRYAANPMLEITGCQFEGPLYIGYPFSCDLTFFNAGDKEFYDEYVLGIMGDNAVSLTVTSAGELIKGAIDIAPGETLTQTFQGAFPNNVGMGVVTPGEYYLVVIDAITQDIVAFWPTPVTVERMPAGIEETVLSGEEDGSSEPVYYNLQGQRVLNPSRGIFIRRQGATVSKELR